MEGEEGPFPGQLPAQSDEDRRGHHGAEGSDRHVYQRGEKDCEKSANLKIINFGHAGRWQYPYEPHDR